MKKPFLRIAVIANVCSIAALVPIALYQMGYIRHLPDPSSPVFDSDLITGSKAAHPMGIPDALLGIGNFAITLLLLTRFTRNSALKPILLSKLLLDGGLAATNSIRQVKLFRKICFWCALTAGAAAVTTLSGLSSVRSRENDEIPLINRNPHRTFQDS
jgi:uncharacterized membrane protein